MGDALPKVMVVDPGFAAIIVSIKDKMPSVQKILINASVPMDLDFPHEYIPALLENKPEQFSSKEPVNPDDVAVLLYTKGVMLTHRGILYGARIKTRHVPVGPGERILCVLPLFHDGGLCDLSFPTLYSCATIVLRRNFSASEFWQCVEKYRGNGFYIPILEAYGATENSGGITANQEDSHKPGSVGTHLKEIQVAIVDDTGVPLPPRSIGEIAVKDDTVMKGYWKSPDVTAETIKNGLLYTGDVGLMDEDGFLFIADRKKDLIQELEEEKNAEAVPVAHFF